MKPLLISAAMALSLSAAAFGGDEGPYKKGTWTSGQYAQQLDGPIGVFPNPASNEVNVVYPGLSGKATLYVIAEDGRIMQQVDVGETDGAQTILDVANLADGLYFIRVTQPNGDDVSRRLVVAK